MIQANLRTKKKARKCEKAAGQEKGGTPEKNMSTPSTRARNHAQKYQRFANSMSEASIPSF